jgi:hypothetical protein
LVLALKNVEKLQLGLEPLSAMKATLGFVLSGLSCTRKDYSQGTSIQHHGTVPDTLRRVPTKIIAKVVKSEKSKKSFLLPRLDQYASVVKSP